MDKYQHFAALAAVEVRGKDYRVRSRRRRGRWALIAPHGGGIEACAFRIAGTPLGKLLLKGEGLPLHVAGHLRRTSWQGKESIELMIEDAADPRGNTF